MPTTNLGGHPIAGADTRRLEQTHSTLDQAVDEAQSAAADGRRDVLGVRLEAVGRAWARVAARWAADAAGVK